MAAAEARAVWQRTANRCFVQEDAKRAPKLACCQSSSSSSKQVDGGPTGSSDVPDNPAVGFMPLNRNSSYSNLPPDTRWWLQLQPSYGYQKGLTREQLNAVEAEVENLKAGISDVPSNISKVRQENDIDSSCASSNTNSDSFLDAYCYISHDCLKKDAEDKKQEVKAPCNKDTKGNSKLFETGPLGLSAPQKSNESCFDLESPWIGGEKNVPWWRMTDKDELASLVAQKSLDYVENCDLPPPQKKHSRRYLSAPHGTSDRDDTVPSSMDWTAQAGCLSTLTILPQGSLDSESKRVSVEDSIQSGSDKTFSYTKTPKEATEIGQVSEDDPCKAQLLEALRHSQTRAREAEKMAKQACAEKEHIVKLFLRQASQLLAYKQWFQRLQLETLYMKNSEQPMSTIFPVVLPWVPIKGKKLRKPWQKSRRGKRIRPRHEFSKYTVAFALGLGLVGAGFLLGWTVGWMLPF